MAKLGFNIGRALNIGAKVAVGAGAFESIGTGSKLLDVGKDIVGGGNRAGAGASLSDRLRGGLSSVSPTFAKAEGLRANIASQNITDELNKTKLDEIRQTAIDKATPFDSNSILPKELQNIPSLSKGITELIRPADTDGSGDVSVAEWKIYQEKAEKSGALQKGIADFMGAQAKEADINIKAMETNIQPLLDKANASGNGQLSPSDPLFTSVDSVREMLKDPAMAGTVDKKLAEQVQALDKMEQRKALLTQGKNTAIASLSTKQALEVAQARKLTAEAANVKADQFESTRTFETLSRAMFNGKSISQLEPEQVDSVVRRKLREDPLKLQQTMDLRKEFNSIDSIKQFDATETRFNQINGMLAATVSGDLKTRNTVDQVLINNFNKMMDESSVVRESEYARTPEGISLINRVKGAFQQKITGGSGLTDEDRRDIQTAARILQEQWLVTARKKASEYILIAEAQGTDPSLIVTNPLLRGGGINQDNVDSFMNR